MLRQIALSHPIEHGEHGLNRGKILSLNDLFKELGVRLDELGNTRTDRFFRNALMHPERNGAKHVTNHRSARGGVIFDGA